MPSTAAEKEALQVEMQLKSFLFSNDAKTHTSLGGILILVTNSS